MLQCGIYADVRYMTASSPAVFVEVTDQPLHLQTLVDKVASERAGAIATFSGVTRNNFEGQTVEKLEYEAYIPMAQKKLEVQTLLSGCFCPAGVHCCLDSSA